MNRTSFILLFLLIASNAAWLAFAPATPDVPPVSAPPSSADDIARGREIERLRKQVAAHETEEPVPCPEPVAPPVPTTTTEERHSEVATEAKKIMDRWVAAMHQVEDPTLRASTIEGLAVGLGGGNPAEQLAALWTLTATWGVEYDRSVYAPTVRLFLSDENPHLRAAAVRALAATNAGPSYLADALPLARDDSHLVRRSMPMAILTLTNCRPDEKTILELSANPMLSESLLRTLDGELTRFRQAVRR